MQPQHSMGAGIAKAIKAAFPAAYDADLATGKGDRGELGTIGVAEVDLPGRGLQVVNAYTQFDWRGPQPRVDYDAVRSAFRMVKARFAGAHIGYPMIGAGLAGGDWSVIEAIIDEELAGERHCLVRLPS